MEKKDFWNVDKVLGICAIVISIITVYISIVQHLASQEQFRIAQEEKMIAVMPYLTMGFENNLEGDGYGLLISNQGLGPAFIESIRVISEKGAEEIDIFEYLIKNHPDEIKTMKHMTHTNIYQGKMIPAGEQFHSFKINGSKEESVRLIELISRISSKEEMGLEIIYSSIYKQVWKLEVQSSIPIKLENYKSAF